MPSGKPLGQALQPQRWHIGERALPQELTVLPAHISPYLPINGCKWVWKWMQTDAVQMLDGIRSDLLVNPL
jgi:hypothetical protein